MITPSILNQEQRLNFFPSITKQYIHFESAIYHFFRLFCGDYDGGFWEFVELDNGGKFLFPKGEKTWNISNPYNHASFELSAEAAGVCITLVTYSFYAMTAWEKGDQEEVDKLAKLEQQLYQYAMQLDEFNRIECILD
ncbi:antirestriction protein [Vibrio europaeus]|uniref:antirestriction protein n=1 Tax=Vibrio europaeus TaxID=300876 RepID=UPI00233E9196|nr:antirestriction protein [Vibrio europaeus]MDC5711138.1 antirestriction protein [Vibrio europaeus]MDC5713167.1 antirestriction protein [Vibrio europaeus]